MDPNADPTEPDPAGPAPPSPRICYCRDVDEQTLRRAIRAGADSIERLAAATGASTGCGTCRYDLEQLLDQELLDEGLLDEKLLDEEFPDR